MARWLDIVLAALGIAMSIPLLLLASLAIAVSSPGPVIFRQKRVGCNGQLFVLYKLRTMNVGRTGPEVTASGDERVTRIGRILRRTKVDELPELWNVLKGDMSLVGPRPEVPRYVDLEDDRWKLVLKSRPGLTDPVTLSLRDEERLLAQVTDNYECFYRNSLQAHKLQGYIDYLQNRSWLTDFEILFRTVLVVIWPGAGSQMSANEIAGLPQSGIPSSFSNRQQ
jgi:lipopolysaccharide/colanic/teichoic acid biosynthesis glycosyltransferase